MRDTTSRRVGARLLRSVALVGAFLGCLVAPASVPAQELADFDYENLSFRGFGLHVGYVLPSTIESAPSFGVRADLGFLGPGLRVVPTISYWSSEMKAEEVAALESSITRLIEEQQPGTPPPSVDLGVIDRSDLVLGLDAHVVWRVRYGFLTYAGAGAAAHFLDGGGPAVDDTFVEDLLDAITAGFNLHGGIEVPVSPRLRVYGEGRFEVLGDFYYPELRLGLHFFMGQPVPGEMNP